jgi:hypothetical protein|tara:strand:+ start:134 stop:499 length:366 start_codon:yes stop_codon:yes gene_type:complete
MEAVKTPSYVHILRGEDIVDSRDIVERIAYLEADTELDDEDKDELKAYQELRAEIGEEYFDQGITFIKDTYFSEAMREDFLEFNQIDEALEMYIDFDTWATDCSMDYTDTEIGGYTYSYRL